MDNSLRADWLAEQSNLHFYKLGSLSARVAGAQQMGQVAAQVELEKLALKTNILAGVRNLGRRAVEAVRGPSAATQARKAALGPGQVSRAAQPRPAPARTVPAAPQTQVPAGRTQVPAPPPGLNLPQQAPFLNRQPLPAPSFPATQKELGLEMQKLRGAGVDPAQAERLRQAFGHKGLRDVSTSTPVGHTGNIRVSHEGMAAAGGSGRGQMIPLYRPKLSAHELNSIILDVIDRSMPSSGALLKTAAQRATLNDEGILKVASENSYWTSTQGSLHLNFLSGVYEEDPLLAWEMAKNAGLSKEAIGKVVGQTIGKLIGGAKNVATAPVRGAKSWWGKSGQNPFQRATQAGGQAAQKAKQTGSQFVQDVRTGYGQATGKIAPKGQFAATADDAMGFAKPTGGGRVIRPQKGWKASTVTPSDATGGTGGTSGLQNLMTGKTPTQSTGSIPTPPAGGAPYRSSSRVPAPPAAPSRPAPPPGAGRDTSGLSQFVPSQAGLAPVQKGIPSPSPARKDYVSDLLKKPTPAAAPGMQPLPKFQTPSGSPIPKAPGGPAISPEGVIDVGALRTNPSAIPSPTPGGGTAVSKAKQTAGTEADVISSGGGQQQHVPAAPTEAPPGFWDRSFGRTARHIGLAGAIGVPMVGMAGLSAAQSFLRPSGNPYQYGMAAPQSWNQSWQM